MAVERSAYWQRTRLATLSEPHPVYHAYATVWANVGDPTEGVVCH